MRSCALCGATKRLAECDGGWVCDDCAESNRLGRDNATRYAKLVQRAARGKADIAKASFAGETIDLNDAYAAEAAATLALDDVLDVRPISRRGSRSIVATATPIAPSVVELEAEAERVALVTRLGVDCAALALDAVATIGASNSLEVMAAHQLALLHSTAMTYAGKANLHADPQVAVKMLNLSLRAMETFQRGMLTLKRYRATGEQKIVIERVNIEGGGQAVIGNVHPGVKGEKL